MWRKPEDAKPVAPAAQAPTPASTSTQPPAAQPRVEQQQQQPVVRSVAGLTAEVVQPSGGTITSTLLIKGDVRGSEDLYIDGEVQGTIQVSNGRVTVGPHGKIAANVDAREIVVRGKVNGGLRGRDRVEIGSTGEVRGNIETSRIAIGEGAQIHSKVEIARASDAQQGNRSASKSSGGSGSSSTSGSASAPQAVVMKANVESGN